jgi:glycerophosphoryl diester phosphodiesterase
MSKLKSIAENLVDLVFSIIPQPLDQNLLKNCKIVAHRGSHQTGFKENTIAGFNECLQNNIWGIEFDLQWTKDLVPVVHHDEHCGRVFKKPDIIISQTDFETLRENIPDIPTLSEVVTQFGKKLHLMIELKESPFFNIKSKSTNSDKIKILTEILHPLESVNDFHVMCLNTKVFSLLTKLNPDSFLSIALSNTTEIFKQTIDSNIGGLTGHYLLTNKKIREQLSRKGKKFGVGFISSKNSLARELNLGSEWVFTNYPLRINSFLKHALK